MILCTVNVGPNVPVPTPNDIHRWILDEEVDDMRKYIDEQKVKWQEYGCTIMADGWTGPTRLSIINIMVYCAGSTVFLKSIDASEKIKNADYLVEILSEVIEQVGPANVIQIVTDNGSNYKSAGKKLMGLYKLYWTSCAAHCLDLMFEDIGKKRSVDDVVKAARQTTKFIYNHRIVLAKMREQGEGEIVRPGPTRFATNYLALTSF